MHIAHRVKLGLVLAAVISIGWMGACSDSPGGLDDTIVPPPQGLVVSDPTVALNASAPVSPTATGAAGSEDVAYASLMPSTAPQGSIASVRAVASGSLVWTTVIDGGFDPVAVAAGDGDTIEVVVRDAIGAEVYVARAAVAAIRRPVVVRTEPPPKKRDVPLNSSLVMVFSEPVAGSSLTPSSVRLLRGTLGIPVPGTVSLLQGSGAAIAFRPSAPLARNTSYRLVVSEGIRDLQGQALGASATVAFATGTSVTGAAASIELSPDTVYMTGATYQMTATVRDAAGHLLTDQPVTWSTSDPSGLSVSPNGLLTVLVAGGYSVTARVDALEASAVVSFTGGPPASVQVLPSSATVAAGDTIILTATVRDAAGYPLAYRPVAWTSGDVAVATVAADSSGNLGRVFATVTGVNPGGVTITASSGTASDTATVTVIPPQPVVSVTVAPTSATLVVPGTKQLIAAARDVNGKVLAGRPVTWTSDNPLVATVDANGLVTAVDTGMATVTATSEGVSGTASINVGALRFTSLSAGGQHTCGLTPNGAAYCWGHNGWGNLGDGSQTSRSTPTPVSGGLSFSTTAAGSYHTCALATGGTAYCWGANFWGQLGDGSTTDRMTPVPVSGGHSFIAIEAGHTHTCGLATDGAAYCWGLNGTGELGIGSTDNVVHSTPVRVAGGLTFASLSATDQHTCALTPNQAAYCWGGNYAVFGDTSTVNRPFPVSGGLSFTAVSAAPAHACGLTTSRAAYCWGSNLGGQLGTGGNDENQPTPVPVAGGLTFASLSAEGGHTCAVTPEGLAYCWGSNVFGSDRTPVAVTGGLTFSLVSAGGAHTCGMSTAGIAYCWGYNDHGQLGNPTVTWSTVPVKVAGQP